MLAQAGDGDEDAWSSICMLLHLGNAFLSATMRKKAQRSSQSRFGAHSIHLSNVLVMALDLAVDFSRSTFSTCKIKQSNRKG